MTDIIYASSGTIEDIEKQSILIRLRLYRGNKTQTALSLGITIQTLNNKLEKYEQEGNQQREREEREQFEREEALKRSRGLGTGHQAQAAGQMFHQPNPGVRVEPAAEAPAQHAVPVQERTEVQSVLPAKSAAGGKKGRG